MNTEHIAKITREMNLGDEHKTEIAMAAIVGIIVALSQVKRLPNHRRCIFE